MNDTSELDGGEVVLYDSPDGEVRLDVRLEHESIWLTQRQMADLFDTSTDNVGLHLKNVYGEGELAEEATTENSSVVRSEGRRRVRRTVRHYSLDAVISVGYRVNSARGTQFRIWATRTLREHLLRGYTLSETRLREKGFGEIEQAVGLLASTLTRHELVSGEGAAVLDVVQHYTRAWRLLLEYDEGRLAAAPPRPETEAFRLTLVVAGELIADLRTALAGIARSPTATSASARCSSWSTSPGTGSLRASTARSVSPTTRWSLWHYLSLEASRGRETS